MARVTTRAVHLHSSGALNSTHSLTRPTAGDAENLEGLIETADL